MSVADFQPVIGLEVHAQLLTRSKIFCGCSTEFGAAHTCAVCLGMPGALPVLNEKVVEYAVRVGRALECRINPVSIGRGRTTSSDLPKGYRISQYDQPLCEHGALEIDGEDGPRRIRILRIHLEEDAGKNVHDPGGGDSLVDLNRSGVPLVEIVSEPDLRSSSEAAEYLKALRDVLVYLGVNDGNLEEGSFRCDANVSVMRKEASQYGQRVELKNINSFRFVQKAIDYEIGRQVEVIESGGKVAQETLFDAVRGETRSMRSKGRRRTTTATSPSRTCRRSASRRGSWSASSASCRAAGRSSTASPPATASRPTTRRSWSVTGRSRTSSSRSRPSIAARRRSCPTGSWAACSG